MNFKQQAARRALEFVHNDMVLGLGTGSTTAYFIELLAEELNSGSLHNITGVPTSVATAAKADRLGIPLTTLAEHSALDLAVDGADEVDPDLNLIKGWGKAFLREKLVEIHAQQFVVLVDESKLVRCLGTHVGLPVEIIPFEWQSSLRWLKSLGCRPELLLDQSGVAQVTDNGNYIVHCWFESEDPSGGLAGIKTPYGLARTLSDRPGIVEHGLFLDMATQVVVAGIEGVKVMERKR
jgi:ribose 5-phosphate isomerase A